MTAADDTETRRAVAAVTRMLTAAGGADPAVTANEIVQALRLHGWRPTQAVSPPPWQPQPGHQPARGDTVAAIAAQARQAITKETP